MSIRGKQGAFRIADSAKRHFVATCAARGSAGFRCKLLVWLVPPSRDFVDVGLCFNSQVVYISGRVFLLPSFKESLQGGSIAARCS